MILRQIYLTIYGLDFSDDLVQAISRETRCLCNFLERDLSKERFRTNGFSRVVVSGKVHPSSETFVNSCKVLGAEVSFCPEFYLTLDSMQKQEYFIKLLDLGLMRCSELHEIPIKLLRAGMHSFRAGGYKNRWTWKKKLVKGHGIKLAFDCELTMERFTMNMKVQKGRELLATRPVFDLFPDEIVFAPKFSDVVVRGTQVEVLNRSRRPSFRIDLKEVVPSAIRSVKPVQ